MKPFMTTADAEPAAPVIATALEELAAAGTSDDVRLTTCRELEQLVVRTRNSVYEVIVLSGDTGEVMVRGGKRFPEFRRAILAGSLFGGSAVKLRSICVGLHLEFRVDGKPFITSRIRSVSRLQLSVPEGRT